jgi:4-diphosphocytidyl-2-C-methyl-D-erythritol kinase
MPILLVNPNIKLSTKAVFEIFSKKGSSNIISGDASVDVEDIFRNIGSSAPNGLIEPAIKLAPVVKDVLSVLEKLKGIGTFGMSGSGATCFAMFGPNDKLGVIDAENRLKAYGWWTASTFLKGT